MGQTKYTYSVAVETANALLALDALKKEIEDSAIVTALDYISVFGDALDIYMKDALSAGDETLLDGVVSAHTGVALVEDILQSVDVKKETPFADKKIEVNGVLKSLFKRIHGVSETVTAGATANIDFVAPYSASKFTGAELFGVDLGDTLNFYVLDDASNTYSGAPGSNYQLNQFGFNVEMPPGGKYKNTSNYDADIYLGMVIRCEYTNNGAEDKYIAMNPWLHEVK